MEDDVNLQTIIDLHRDEGIKLIVAADKARKDANLEKAAMWAAWAWVHFRLGEHTVGLRYVNEFYHKDDLIPTVSFKVYEYARKMITGYMHQLETNVPDYFEDAA